MNFELLTGDARGQLKTLADGSVHCCITSPPYWGLRDYKLPPSIWGGDPECQHDWQQHVQPAANGIVASEMQGETLTGNSATRKPRTSAFCNKCSAWRGCLGLEPTPERFCQDLVEIFREVRRVLRPDGTLWVNIGDSFASGKGSCYNPGGGESSLGKEKKAGGAYPLDRGNKSTLAANGLKPKDLVGVPWMLAFALRVDGWWLRRDLIWHKENCLPESVTDRCSSAHEYIFMFTKSERYFYDRLAIAEPCESGPSDIRKMVEQKDRQNGQKYLIEDDMMAASSQSNIGRKRSGAAISMPSNYKGSLPGRQDGPGQDRRGTGARSAMHGSTLNGTAHGRHFLGDNIPEAERREDRREEHAERSGREDGLTPPPQPGHGYDRGQLLRNRRSVWSITTRAFAARTLGRFEQDHYASFPVELPEICLRAGTSERGVCPKCGAPWERTTETEYKHHENWFGDKQDARHSRGKAGNGYNEPVGVLTLGWQPTCTCNQEGIAYRPDDLELIGTPTGERIEDDPSLEVGRAGFSRPRGEDEGVRPITRYEQRAYAKALKAAVAAHPEMQVQAGAFAWGHYVRTDRTGARPASEYLLERWIANGWIERVEPPQFTPFEPVPATVLDCFAGVCSTGIAALRNGRDFIGIDLSEVYLRIGEARIGADARACQMRLTLDY